MSEQTAALQKRTNLEKTVTNELDGVHKIYLVLL